jgi:hypothetical protein
MKKSRILKLSTLIGLNACPDQVKLFRETFGESVEVTEKLCLSVSDKFAWTWAAHKLLPASAQIEYVRVTAPAYAEYDSACASDVTRSYYERVGAPARAKYNRAQALAFARGYLS